MTTHLTHWGAFEADSDGERLMNVRPWRGDPEPTPLIGNIASAQHHPTRIDRPYIRRGWLESGPAPGPRGSEGFVPVSWERALDLLAGELGRVYRQHGPEAVYGGSYGWASAGRFHHAQSQLHRFLNCLGGYVRHVNSYSLGTSTVFLPYVLGDIGWVTQQATAKAVLAEHSELVVAFGGLSPKNAAVSPGGVSRHNARGWIAAARARGCRFVSISPLRDDTAPEGAAEWIAPLPGTDVAMMLALAQVLDEEGLADQEFSAPVCGRLRALRGIPAWRGGRSRQRSGVGGVDHWCACRACTDAGARDGDRAHARDGELVASAGAAR